MDTMKHERHSELRLLCLTSKAALPIEQSTPGFANSRVRAPPHVHPRGLGSRPSSLRGLNEEFYKKKLKTKKLRLLED